MSLPSPALFGSFLAGWIVLSGCGAEQPSGPCGPTCENTGAGAGTGGSASSVAGSGGVAAAAGTGTGSGGDGAGNGGATSGSGGVSSPVVGPLPPSYRAREYAVPEPMDAVACSGATNASAVLERVAFVQTHALEPSWPLFFLVAERPALLEVAVSGAGAAPEVRAEAFSSGRSLGQLCLAGPSTLPTTVEWSEHDRPDRYRATLPAAWLHAGTSVTIRTGAQERTFGVDELALGAAPDLNLIMLPVDVLNYNDGKPDVAIPEGWLEDFAGAVPAARVRLGHFPGRVKLSPFVVSGNAEAGLPPTRLERRPCRDDEAAGAACAKSDIPPMNISGAALRVISAIHRATGEFAYAHYYGNTEHFNPGGWGGGRDFVGADFDDIFIHEMGHALSLPHWGQGAFQNTTPSRDEFRYPYGGNDSDGGGRGEMWNYYQSTASYASPICQDAGNDWFGKERSDAMQRNNACIEWRGGQRGRWDGFGDFSALAAYRFMTGAAERAGIVPYRGAESPFHLSRQRGFPNLVIDEQGRRSLVRREQPTELLEEERYDFLVPQAWDTPVATLYGSFHPEFADANVLYAPIEYQGTLPTVIDPTDPVTFSRLLADDGPYADYFWWPRDLTLKVTYADGHELIALLANQSIERDPDLGSGPWRGDLVYFALNVPRDQPIRRVDLYQRPFLVRGTDDPDAGNIRNPELGITSSTFMADARLVATWEGP